MQAWQQGYVAIGSVPPFLHFGALHIHRLAREPLTRALIGFSATHIDHFCSCILEEYDANQTQRTVHHKSASVSLSRTHAHSTHNVPWGCSNPKDVIDCLKNCSSEKHFIPLI